MRILGVDPGVTGGIAIIEATDTVPTLIGAWDIPIVGTAAKERVDALTLRDLIKQHNVAFAYIERGQAMPRQGASSGFKYGRACGALETVIALSEIPFEIVEPAMWKRALRLPGKDKEAARQRALQLLPAGYSVFARRKDHGRAEAALIALYGLRTSGTSRALVVKCPASGSEQLELWSEPA